MNWKDLLYCRKETKAGIILLLVLVILTLVYAVVADNRSAMDIVLVQNDSIIKEYDAFRSTLKQHVTTEIEYKKPVQEKQYSEYKSTTQVSDNNLYSLSDREEHYKSQFKSEKLSPGETIFLNKSDSTDWKKIPGIGDAYSSRIVKYRNMLGGFVRKEQLTEVYGIDNDLFLRIAPFIEEDINCTKLTINTLDFKELLRHPYLNYKQVQAIVNLRRKKGDIISINELSMLNEFTSDDIFRLEHYLEF